MNEQRSVNCSHMCDLGGLLDVVHNGLLVFSISVSAVEISALCL